MSAHLEFLLTFSHQAGSCGVGTYTCSVFINDCTQSIQTESHDKDIWNFIDVSDMKMLLMCVFYFPLFMLPICHPLILDSCFLSSEYTVCSLANLILNLLPNLRSSIPLINFWVFVRLMQFNFRYKNMVKSNVVHHFPSHSCKNNGFSIHNAVLHIW